MSALYREFVLRSPSVWATFRLFVKANALALLEAGTPMRVICTTEERKRNAEQNKRLWGYLYKNIAEQAWVNGQQFDADVWHEWYARKFGVLEEIVLPDGEIVTRRKSTRDMTVREFSEFMQRIEADAASEHGVSFE